MQVQVLGPLAIGGRGDSTTLGGDKPRRLLAVLALNANSPVTVDLLIEVLWDAQPPASARKNLQSYVVLLRRALDLSAPAGSRPAAIERDRAAYRLAADADSLDILLFADLYQRINAMTQAEPRQVSAAVGRALRLWRGPAVADCADALRMHQPRIAALEEQRLALIELRLRAELDLGRPGEAIDELKALIEAAPLREPLYELLMTSLHRAGRTVEAMQVYRRLRDELDAELGVEPGPTVRRVFLQLASVPARAEAPMLASALVLAQLPPRTSPFVGRGDLLRSVIASGSDSADAARVVLICGGGGVGKTALAVEAAHRLSGRFTGGQLFADLRGFTPGARPAPPGEVLSGLLRDLGVVDGTIPPTQDERSRLLRSLLDRRSMLLVLDNAADVDQVRPLLPGSPGCMTIVTSRDRLPGLVVRDGAVRLSVGPLSEPESAELLQSVAGAQAGAGEGARRVAELCGRLPLALRIVAEQLSSSPGLTASQLAADLSAERDVLDRLAVAGDSASTLRSVLDCSHRALPAAQARAFGLLGWTPGPDVTAPALAAMLGTDPAAAAADLRALWQLSLAESDGSGRFRMHDLVRQYARSALEVAGLPGAGAPDRKRALRRLMEWYLLTADAALWLVEPQRQGIALPEPDPGLRPLSFPDAPAAAAWYHAERRNLVAACLTAEQEGEDDIAWLLPSTLVGFFLRHMHSADMETTHLSALVAVRRAHDQHGEARVLNNLGIAYRDSLRPEEAMDCYRQALPLYQSLDDIHGQASCLSNLATALRDLCRFPEAVAYYRRVLPLARRAGAQRGEAITLAGIAEAHLGSGHLAAAQRVVREAIALSASIGDTYGEAGSRHLAARISLARGDSAQAQQQAASAVELRTGIADRHGLADSHLLLAQIACGAADATAAEEHLAAATAALGDLSDVRAMRIGSAVSDFRAVMSAGMG